MEICRPGRRTVSAQEFEPRRAAYVQLLSGDDAHQGGPAPPFCAALNNGAVHGPSLGDHLEQSGQCCAIVDWCSSEMDGGNDWLYITSRYREMHGWAPGKTVEEINAGTSDTFKRTLALVKVKAQYERAVHRFDMKTRKGMFQYTVVPVNYRYSADQEPIVATVIYKVKVSVGDRTQEELRRGACFDYSTDIISLYSPSGGVLVQNRRAEHFYATSPRFAAEFKKRETVDLLRLLFTESSAYDLCIKSVVEEHGTYTGRVLVGPGTWHVVHVTACFDPGSASNAWAMVVTQTDDVTEKARLLKEESERKNMLLSTVSHEMKTPLNGIMSLVDLLKDELEGSVSAEQRDTLDVILESSRRLNKLVTSILDARFLRDSKLPVKLADQVSLHEVAASVVRLCRPLALKAGLALENRVPEDLVRIRSDGERITQILQNLVANSIKFSERGVVRIEAAVAQPGRGAEQVVIEVHDEGIGIAEENHGMIFEPMTQVDASHTRTAGGIGLGLHLASGLAQVLGGTLDVASRLGEGSVFSLTLPVDGHRGASAADLAAQVALSSAAEAPSGPEPPPLPPYAAGDGIASGWGYRSCFDETGTVEVMSVDDEPTNQVVIQAFLKKRGITCTPHPDGASALSDLEGRVERRGYLPDVVLLDVMMPGLSGYEVARRIRRMTDLVPIIMVSAKAGEESIVKGLEVGANDYVTKPFHRVELLARIDTQLQLRSSWMKERDREMTKALLEEMLPQHIIHRLKETDELKASTWANDHLDVVVADKHDMVTFLFSDVVGFTTMSSQYPSKLVVTMLNDLFRRFDSLTDKHGVYKVETIGDGYMAAAGHLAEDDYQDAVVRVITMAVDFQQAVVDMRTSNTMQGSEYEKLYEEMTDSLKIRIGIHTGPALSGVIGTKMRRYAFFGDTVNTAARMESYGFPQCVHLSADVVATLQGGALGEEDVACGQLVSVHDFAFASCGLRRVKGKGWMHTMLLCEPQGHWRGVIEGLRASKTPKQETADEGAASAGAQRAKPTTPPVLTTIIESTHAPGPGTPRSHTPPASPRMLHRDNGSTGSLRRFSSSRSLLSACGGRGADGGRASLRRFSGSPEMQSLSLDLSSVLNGDAEEMEALPAEEWSDDAVVAWLLHVFPPEIGAHYVAAFRRCCVNGAVLLALAPEEAEEDLGMGKMHAKRLFSEIAKLRL